MKKKNNNSQLLLKQKRGKNHIYYLHIYKSYAQSEIDYGSFIWGCTTEVILDGKKKLRISSKDHI